VKLVPGLMGMGTDTDTDGAGVHLHRHGQCRQAGVWGQMGVGAPGVWDLWMCTSGMPCRGVGDPGVHTFVNVTSIPPPRLKNTLATSASLNKAQSI